jgi:four helix bundle protein
MLENPKYKDNLIVKMTFEFALNIIKYSEELAGQRKFIMADQLYRCGTSIGSNIAEAQNAESKADFIHKFKIAAKECYETAYRLALCKHSKGYPDPGTLLKEQEDIGRVITKIISNTKIKQRTKY